MGKKYVYMFTEGNAKMRNLLGGKGAGLAEMTNAHSTMRITARSTMRSWGRLRKPSANWRKSPEKSSGIKRIRFLYLFVPVHALLCRV